MRAELEQRDIDSDGLDRLSLKKALETELAGIRRPPALLCSDMPICLSSYEISHLEPLHDLKSIIGM